MKMLCLLMMLATSLCFSGELITQKSEFFHEKTVSVIKKFLKKKKYKVFDSIDHHKGAKKVKLNLDKNTVIIFGDPKLGTLLMQENQFIGLELPLKLLVHTKGKVTKITYKKAHSLKKEYKLSSKLDDLLEKVDRVYKDISKHVSNKKEEIKSYD